ncbi:GTPase RsgA [Methanococcoides sp. AM1]|uniref:GTPase RsgA n=1 Tax=Methanococcoides sp. AM1 TaxID=1201011 RepID=UPI001084241B|nr:GTPase RsgA [Methanococcoides sp. AM1]
MNDQYEPEISGHSCTNNLPGWNKELESAFSAYSGPYLAGRVVAQHKAVFDILVPDDVISVQFDPSLLQISKQPVVGDFVVLLDQDELNSYKIVDILPRRTCLSRGASGDCREEQLIAANIDTIFLITSIEKDLNLRRLKRYLTIVHSSGAKPVVLLNKIDLADDPSQMLEKIQSVTGDVPVIAISALSKESVVLLKSYINPSDTVALLGSPGVGKSMLIDAFFGKNAPEIMNVWKDDENGRQMLTTRQALLLPNGAIIINNPAIHS